MFDTTNKDLVELLKAAHTGRLQLPDFQRDYVWNDDDVRSLIASIANGFPVGALLTLKTGGNIRFKPRLLEGIPTQDMEPEELLLDGQQRITSLYQAMYSDSPVRTRTPQGAEVARYYYLDIEKAVDSAGRVEDAIEGIPGDKIRRVNFGRTIELDLSNTDAEFENNLFPLRLACKPIDTNHWIYSWQNYWKEKDCDIFYLCKKFQEKIIYKITRYEMPLIRLDKENSREAICLVFEKVNVGGKKLDAFELLTAIFAADNFDLRKDWNGSSDPDMPGRNTRIVGALNRRDVLSKVASTDFLKACTLLHTISCQHEAVSCQREALLSLPLDAYRDSADSLEEGFIQTAGFLNEHKIIWHRDVPYPPQIITLAATFSILGRDARSVAAKKKLSRWFWSVTLGELYGAGVDTQIARDVPALVNWIRGGSHPQSIDEALFQKDRLLSLRTRQSAAYKGLHALMMRHGCRDFITGRETDIMTFFNDRIDIHHIFPQSWCKNQGIEPRKFNSIINKTPLSSKSNKEIGGVAPSIYLRRIENKNNMPSEELDEILRGHLIEPEFLRNDDFDQFFEARMKALASMIEKAMGKSVVWEQGTNEEERDVAALDDEEYENELRNL